MRHSARAPWVQWSVTHPLLPTISAPWRSHDRSLSHSMTEPSHMHAEPMPPFMSDPCRKHATECMAAWLGLDRQGLWPRPYGQGCPVLSPGDPDPLMIPS
jgi:hypothetical protein